MTSVIPAEGAWAIHEGFAADARFGRAGADNMTAR
jgi:hypothetical protein